jgi:3',5'-cyclic-AMP phosphodiesterase
VLKIVQLSDTHLDGDADVRARLTHVARRLRELAVPPDLLLVTGDITERSAGDAAAGEFGWIDGELNWGIPVAYCPGNSDETGAYRRFLTDRGDDWQLVGDQVHQVQIVDGVALVLIDCTVPGEFYGRLHPESLDWIRGTLAGLEPDQRAILAMHQPPVALGHPFVDQLRLLDSEDLERIVAGTPNVIATLCGHIHGAIATTFGGKPLLVGPGVHSFGQLPLEYADPNPGLIKEDFPPAYAVHLIDDRRVITYFETCPEFAAAGGATDSRRK